MQDPSEIGKNKQIYFEIVQSVKIFIKSVFLFARRELCRVDSGRYGPNGDTSNGSWNEKDR